MLIGKSLSFCISSICRGEVQESDVDYIITSTKAEDRDVLIFSVIQSYKEFYWLEFPELAEEITLRLWDAGKIKQPMLEGREPHCAFPIWEATV